MRYAELTGVDGHHADAVRESTAYLAASGTPHLFRTTRVSPLLEEADYDEITRQIPPGSPHCWQNYRVVRPAQNTEDGTRGTP